MIEALLNLLFENFWLSLGISVVICAAGIFLRYKTSNVYQTLDNNVTKTQEIICKILSIFSLLIIGVGAVLLIFVGVVHGAA